MRPLAVSMLAFSLAGCVSTEVAKFQPKGAGQSAIVRDGRPALVSKRKNSVVLVSPLGREMRSGSRPVYVLAVTNLSGQPLDLKVGNIRVTQKRGDQIEALQVIGYDQLVSEERTRQVVGAILVGLAAGANAAAAANAGHGTSYSTVSAGGRTATVQTTFYSPTAAAVAQANAVAQNDAMIANTVEVGRQNMAALEREVVKDHSVMPGEWYGGQLHFSPPTQPTDGSPKTYSILVPIGADVHEIEVVQGAAGASNPS